MCEIKACNKRHFRCADSRQCVSEKSICDGVQDCDDGSDERKCEHGKWVCLNFFFLWCVLHNFHLSVCKWKKKVFKSVINVHDERKRWHVLCLCLTSCVCGCVFLYDFVRV